MKKSVVVLIICVILSSFTIAVFAAGITPIVDGTGIINIDQSWDEAPHTLPGLLVERGNGFVNFVMPRSPDNITLWGLHGFVTFYDASVTSVDFYTEFNKLEANGNNGFAGGINPFDDEIDWFGDGHQVPGGQVSNSSEVEMWLNTNTARDAFTVNLTYGFCPRMKIENIEPDFWATYYQQTHFRIGSTDYPYGSIVGLGNCTIVEIDIKPGSYPSCFNNNGKGVIPVAILGSDDFDVYTIDPGTVSLEGLAVATKGKSNKLLAAYEDFNSDGFMDLVIKLKDIEGTFSKGSGTAILQGLLYDGSHIMGEGDICITQ